MRIQQITSALLPLALLAGSLALPGCAASTPEAETPEDAASEDSASDDSSKEESKAAEKEDSTKDDAKETAPDASEESTSLGEGKAPDDVLLKEGTAFMLDQAASDPGKKAEERCEKQSKGDVAKKANCVSKALNKMEREGILFDEDGGNWYYVRFAVIKGRKNEYNHIQIEVGKPEGKKITFKTVGKDKGSRRHGPAPKELHFVVEDEYTIYMDDPKRGRLVFEPKMGLFPKE